MATTIKTPLKLSEQYACSERFQNEEAVGPEHGGTGYTVADLTGHAGDYLKVNAGEDGFEFDAPAGGGGGDALGTGFTSGGGAGTIPNGTTASLVEEGVFSFNYYNGQVAIKISDYPDGQQGVYFQNPSSEVTMQLSGNGFVFTDGLNQKGATYAGDYSAQTILDDRAIPDVGTTKNIIQNGPPQYTTTERDALSPALGWTIYCTDATANDSSTGVVQTYNGSTWKNHW